MSEVNAAPVTPEVTAAPEAPRPPATVADFSPDDASIDRAQYVAAFERITEGLILSARGSYFAGEGSRIGSEARIALLQSITRADNGATDWAGQTTAYKEALGAMLDRWASSATFLGNDGSPRSVTSVDVNQYRSRISTYTSKNRLLYRAMAEHRARTRTDSPASTEKVAADFDAATGTPLSHEVRETIRQEMAAQVSAKGKPLTGMDPEKNLPEASGPRPRDNQRVHPKNADGTGSALSAWETVRKQITKGEGGFLRLDRLAVEVHRVVSDTALAIAGPIGEAVTPNENLPANGEGRFAALVTLGACEDLIHALLAALDPNDPSGKDGMVPFLWNENPNAEG